jgi:dTDP-glucose 4,6-dehydratase
VLGAERRNIDLVETICKHLDTLHPRSEGRRYNELISFVEDRAGHDFRYAIDDRKARRELGFNIQYDFESGLLSTIKWYLQNESWLAELRGRKQ